MTFDNEQQKQIVLGLIQSANIPGHLLDTIMQFKQEVLQAVVAAPGPKPENKP